MVKLNRGLETNEKLESELKHLPTCGPHQSSSGNTQPVDSERKCYTHLSISQYLNPNHPSQPSPPSAFQRSFFKKFFAGTLLWKVIPKFGTITQTANKEVKPSLPPGTTKERERKRVGGQSRKRELVFVYTEQLCLLLHPPNHHLELGAAASSEASSVDRIARERETICTEPPPLPPRPCSHRVSELTSLAELHYAVIGFRREPRPPAAHVPLPHPPCYLPSLSLPDSLQNKLSIHSSP